MISFAQAYQIVMGTARDFGKVKVPLAKAHGRVLAENIFADRDFPPFDRATKDGIAIQYNEGKARDFYNIKGIAAAGSPQQVLRSAAQGHEIMTGAILPTNANAIVMYEHLDIMDGVARVNKPVTVGQNIHFKGSDKRKGDDLLDKGNTMTAAEIGVLATVGKKDVWVEKNPKITLFSTGDELVSVAAIPKQHQIRQSNAHTLRASLYKSGMASNIVHVSDDKNTIKMALLTALEKSDVLLISGGVSKGKYDYLPEILEAVGVKKHFHRVRQRPGKPFWFGEHKATKTTIFGFPGNPTSTFANFHVYFKPWLNQCFGRSSTEIHVFMEEPFKNTTELTQFVRAKVFIEKGCIKGKMVQGNGSGDLTSLTEANGFIQLKPKQLVKAGGLIPFIPTRQII